MAKGREIKLPLPAAADLFSTQEERDEAKREFIADIPLEEISDLASSNFSISGWHWRMETISSNALESCSCNSKMIILPIISPPYLMFFSKRLITPGYSNVSMYSSKQIF